eukprot:scaffold13870_cov77-Cyclotella_meneghiniana.AAC.2
MPLINVISSDSVPEMVPNPLHKDSSQPSSSSDLPSHLNTATAITTSLPSHHIDEWEALLSRTSPHYALSANHHHTHTITVLELIDSGREQLCYWAYSVLDHYSLDRSLAAIAFSMFDRYILLHKDEASAMDHMELVALTCVYIAAKVHSTNGKFPLNMLAKLAGNEVGRFTVEQIEAVELSICTALDWRVNPTTPFLFLDVAFDLLEENYFNSIIILPINSEESQEEAVTMELLTSMKEMTSFLAEMSVIDIYSASVSPASIAGGALLVAMEELSAPSSMRSLLLQQLRLDPVETEQCAHRLSGLFTSWKEGEVSKMRDDSSSGSRSPTGVRLSHDDNAAAAALVSPQEVGGANNLKEAFEETLHEGDAAFASAPLLDEGDTHANSTAAANASAPVFYEDKEGIMVQGEAKRRKIQATSFM